MRNVFEAINGAKFTINATGAVKQTEARVLKQDVLAGLMGAFAAMADGNDNVNVFRVAEGVAVEIFNEATGKNITFVLDAVVKNTDFDAATEAELFEAEVAEKAAKKEAAAKAKAEKIARDKADRELKEKIRAAKLAEARAAKEAEGEAE